MVPAQPVPVLVVRLSHDGHPWRLMREFDTRLRLLNLPINEMAAWLSAPSDDTQSVAGIKQAPATLQSPMATMAALINYAQAQPWKGPRLVLNSAYPHNAASLWTLLDTLGKCHFGTAAWKEATCLSLHNEAGRLLAFAISAHSEADPRHFAALDSILDPEINHNSDPAIGADTLLKRITVALPDYGAHDASRV